MATAPRPGRSILSGPIDLDRPARRRTEHPTVAAVPGLAVTPRGTPIRATVVECLDDRVLLRDRDGSTHWMRLLPGGFEVEGRTVSLVRPAPERNPAAAARTASGSVAAPRAQARVARASRILVEGRHDAELVERVWGEDLRDLGVVVELLEGADNLEAVVRGFGPGPGRRLGILLDHLVDGSKEQRIAAAIDHPDVCITGHPFVDIWQAIKPATIGLDAWPLVPRGTPWKEGIIAALGQDTEPGAFWRSLLAHVEDWTQLEAPLIGAVETLIDFVE